MNILGKIAYVRGNNESIEEGKVYAVKGRHKNLDGSRKSVCFEYSGIVWKHAGKLYDAEGCLDQLEIIGLVVIGKV